MKNFLKRIIIIFASISMIVGNLFANQAVLAKDENETDLSQRTGLKINEIISKVNGVSETLEDAVFANMQSIACFNCFDCLNSTLIDGKINLEVEDIKGNKVGFIPCHEETIIVNLALNIYDTIVFDDTQSAVYTYSFEQKGINPKILVKIEEAGLYRFTFTSEGYCEYSMLVYYAGTAKWEDIKKDFENNVNGCMHDVASQQQVQQWLEYIDSQDWKEIAEKADVEDVDGFILQIQSRKNALLAMQEMDWEELWRAVENSDSTQISSAYRFLEWLNKTIQLENSNGDGDDYIRSYFVSCGIVAEQALWFIPMGSSAKVAKEAIVLRNGEKIASLFGSRIAEPAVQEIVVQSEKIAKAIESGLTVENAAKASDEYAALAKASKAYCSEASLSYEANALALRRTCRLMESGSLAEGIAVTFDESKILNTEFSNYLFLKFNEGRDYGTFEFKVYLPDEEMMATLLNGNKRDNVIKHLENLERFIDRSEILATTDRVVTYNELYQISGKKASVVYDFLKSDYKNSIPGHASGKREDFINRISDYLKDIGNEKVDLSINSEEWNAFKKTLGKDITNAYRLIKSQVKNHDELLNYYKVFNGQNTLLLARVSKYGLGDGFTLGYERIRTHSTIAEIEKAIKNNELELWRVDVADIVESKFTQLMNAIANDDQIAMKKILKDIKSRNFFQGVRSIQNRCYENKGSDDMRKWIDNMVDIAKSLDTDAANIIDAMLKTDVKMSSLENIMRSFLTDVGKYRNQLIIDFDKTAQVFCNQNIAAELLEFQNIIQLGTENAMRRCSAKMRRIEVLVDQDNALAQNAIATLKNEFAVYSAKQGLNRMVGKIGKQRVGWSGDVYIEYATVSKTTLDAVKENTSGFININKVLMDEFEYELCETPYSLLTSIQKAQSELGSVSSIGEFVKVDQKTLAYLYDDAKMKTFLSKIISVDRNSFDSWQAYASALKTEASQCMSAANKLAKTVQEYMIVEEAQLVKAILYCAQSNKAFSQSTTICTKGIGTLITQIHQQSSCFNSNELALIDEAYRLIKQSREIVIEIREVQIGLNIRALEAEAILAGHASDEALTLLSTAGSAAEDLAGVKTGFASTDLLATLSAEAAVGLIALGYIRNMQNTFVEMDAGSINIDALANSAIAIKAKYDELIANDSKREANVIAMMPQSKVQVLVADKENLAPLADAHISMRILPGTLFPYSTVSSMDRDYPTFDCGKTDKNGRIECVLPQTITDSYLTDKNAWLTIEKEGYTTYDSVENGMPIALNTLNKESKECVIIDLGTILLEKEAKKNQATHVSIEGSLPDKSELILYNEKGEEQVRLPIESDFSGFTFSLEEGRYYFELMYDGQSIGHRDFDVLINDEDRTEITMNSSYDPSQDNVVQGCVVDHFTQKPISNVEVKVYDGDGFVKATLHSDDEGLFSLSHLSAGDYQVLLTKENYNDQQTIISASAPSQGEPKQISMIPYTIVSGIVCEKDTNKPLKEANVKVKYYDQRMKQLEVKTDKKGRYEFLLPACEYTIEVSCTDYITIKKTGIIEGAVEKLQLNFELYKAAPMSCNVKDKDTSDYIGNVNVSAVCLSGEQEIVEGVSLLTGRYTLQLIKGSKYEITFEKEGYQTITKVITVTGDNAIMNIEMERNDASIDGVVKDNNGNPISHVTVQLYNKQDQIVSTVYTDANGHYHMPGKAGVLYAGLKFTHPDYATARYINVTYGDKGLRFYNLNPEKPVTVLNQGRVVEGKAVDGETGEGIKGVVIDYVNGDTIFTNTNSPSLGWPFTDFESDALSGEDGSYRIVLPGNIYDTFILCGRSDAYAYCDTQYTKNAGNTIIMYNNRVNVTVDFSKSGANLTTLPSYVKFTNTKTGRVFSFSTKTNPTTFTIPSGEYTVNTSINNYLPIEMTCNLIGKQNVTLDSFDFIPYCEIRVDKVTGKNDEQAIRFSLDVTDSFGKSVYSSKGMDSYTKTCKVTPGTYTLEIRDCYGGVHIERITLEKRGNYHKEKCEITHYGDLNVTAYVNIPVEMILCDENKNVIQTLSSTVKFPCSSACFKNLEWGDYYVYIKSSDDYLVNSSEIEDIIDGEKAYGYKVTLRDSSAMLNGISLTRLYRFSITMINPYSNKPITGMSLKAADDRYQYLLDEAVENEGTYSFRYPDYTDVTFSREYYKDYRLRTDNDDLNMTIKQGTTILTHIIACNPNGLTWSGKGIVFTTVNGETVETNNVRLYLEPGNYTMSANGTNISFTVEPSGDNKFFLKAQRINGVVEILSFERKE